MPSPSGPFPAVLCPSIGRPGGAGVRRLGCRGAEAGLLSALPRHSSCSIVPIPMPFSSPISIPGAVLENFSLVLVSKAALELAPLPSPGFCSLLFVVLQTSGVMAFGHHPLPFPSLCGRVTLSVGVHSVYAPVGESGGLLPPSISGKRSFQCRFILLLVPFFASCSVTRSTSSRLCALASPRLCRSSPGSWLLFQLYSILWVSVCVDTSTPGWSSLPLRSLSSRFFCLSSDFVTIVIHPRYSNLVPSQVMQYLWVVIDSTSFRAFPSVARISRLQSTAAVFLSCA